MKTFILKNFILLILLISACASNKKVFYPVLCYTSTNLTFEQLDTKYQGVPIHKGKNIDHFVEEASFIDTKQLFNNSHGFNKFQVFIDKQGNVETILKIIPFEDFYDSLSVDAIRKSKFKPLSKASKRIKYSVFVLFEFYENEKIYPAINGQWAIPKHKYYAKFESKIDDANTIPFDSLDVKPEIIHIKHPRYPDLARKSGFEGIVIVNIVIDEKGNVIKTSISKSIPDLDDAAREAAMGCKFKPGYLNGKPVKVAMKLPMHFRLRR